MSFPERNTRPVEGRFECVFDWIFGDVTHAWESIEQS